MPHTPDDEFTELVDADISRVDLVDRAANGLPILIAKAADDGGPAGLIAPDLVRSLIGKTATPDPKEGETVTMSGSPGAIARLIHEAAARPAADAITKDAAMADEHDLDPDALLAEPQQNAPGNPNSPGSPAWEAIDAATACKWTAILSRAKSALAILAERELIEAESAHPDDYEHAINLEDAKCAIDYAIGILAPYAADQKAEVHRSTAELEAIGKALAAFDPATLDVIESLNQVEKAGRSLSAANEQAIRDAVSLLEKVLASLPAAPNTRKSGQPVAKEDISMQPETGTAPEAIEATAEPTEVGKADDDSEGKKTLVAVYNAKGKIIGIVDPEAITPVSGTDTDDDTDDAPAEPPAEPAGDAADLEPAPAATVGTPADKDVAKAADTPTDTDADPAPAEDAVTKATDTGTDDVLKSSDIRDMVKGMLDEHSAGHAEQLAQQGETIAELVKAVETLKGQVRALEEQPAEPKVFANGAVPPAPALRGQDHGAAPLSMAKAADLKKALYSGTAAEQNEAAKTMQQAAIEALQAIHQRRPQ